MCETRFQIPPASVLLCDSSLWASVSTPVKWEGLWLFPVLKFSLQEVYSPTGKRNRKLSSYKHEFQAVLIQQNRKNLWYSCNKALKSTREQNTSRSCLTRFKDSKCSPWMVKHSSISLTFKVRPHCLWHESLIHEWPCPWWWLGAKRYTPCHMSARDMFHYVSGYTLEKMCHPHPGRGGQAYWTRGVHLIQGIPDHCLGLDLSGPGSSRGTEPIRSPFVKICRERLKDLCSLVILLSQVMGWGGAACLRLWS